MPDRYIDIFPVVTYIDKCLVEIYNIFLLGMVDFLKKRNYLRIAELFPFCGNISINIIAHAM